MNKTKIVALGEIMLRLSAENGALLKDAQSFEACYGGSESNVLAALSSLGHETEYVSVIPENEIGQGAVNHLKRLGVGVKFVRRAGDNLGMYFLETGFGERPSKVVYNRRGSADSQIDENTFDYDEIFDGCKLFHVCGISAAISENGRRATLRFLKEASSRNIAVSFDFNYRAKLWTLDEASEAYREIAPYVDVCFGNVFDLKRFLGICGETDEDVIRAFFEKYKARYLCYTEKATLSSTVNERSGKIYTYENGALCRSELGPFRFEILDRIGAGDSFSAGVLHSLVNGGNADDAVRFGLACCVLKHSLRGDVFTLGESDVNAFLSQKTKDVQR